MQTRIYWIDYIEEIYLIDVNRGVDQVNNWVIDHVINLIDF
jgi:hypothetical protein